MSEFNTGKPPAGEAGMCVTKDLMCTFAQYWTGRYWGGVKSKGCFKRAFLDRADRSLWQEHEWRWATLAELTAAGIPESEARGMVHKSMLADAPWLPPQVPGYGRWIEGSPQGVSGIAQLLFADEREAREFDGGSEFDAYRLPSELRTRYRVAAYCLKVTHTEQTEPTTAEVEATQKPQSLPDFVRDMERDEEAAMAADQNEAMKNRDAFKRAITPPPKDEGWREYDPKYPPIQPYRMDFKTVVEGEHVRHFYRRADTSAVDVVLYARNGLTLVSPWTNRLGGNWGAFQ